jgi:transcriptional regulator with XRE-family HTH domain
VETFEFVGETLRRLRKESGRTLEEISAQAGLGRGQLSRIENGRQSATLKTLAKILEAQGISRAEFFRRYDLVEAERLSAAAAPVEHYPQEPTWPAEVREVLSRVSSFMESSFAPHHGMAQGAIELGGHIVVFRVVPRGTAHRTTAAGGAEPSTSPSKRRRRAPGTR